MQRRFSIDDTFTSMVVFEGPRDIPEPPLSLFFPLGIFFSKLYMPSWLLPIRMSSHELAHPFTNPSPTSQALINAAISSCPVTQTRRPPCTTRVSLMPMDFIIWDRFDFAPSYCFRRPFTDCLFDGNQLGMVVRSHGVHQRTYIPRTLSALALNFFEQRIQDNVETREWNGAIVGILAVARIR